MSDDDLKVALIYSGDDGLWEVAPEWAPFSAEQVRGFANVRSGPKRC